MSAFKRTKIGGLVLALAVIGACAGGPAPAQTPAPPPAAAPRIVMADGTDYRFGNGDELKITVFNEPTLSGPFTVDGTGSISMSLIGEVKVASLSAREAETAIQAKLKEGQYLRDPKVSVEMTKGRPFYVKGEVNRPGQYPYTSGLTVENAITAAGDFTYRAERKNIIITHANGKEEKVTLTPSLTVAPGDSIRVKERLF